MQRVHITNDEFEGWANNSYITESIYDENDKEINLRGIKDDLIINQSNNRNADNSLIFNFVRWYIDKKWIKYCPYCWKNYLAYFCSERYKRNSENYRKWDCKPGRIISWFDIEHFFPKNYQDNTWNKPYAQLAKNLYNWHLSCTICNQRLKKDRDVLQWAVKKDPIFNPYFWWIYKDWDKIKVDDSTFDEKVTFVWTPNLDYDSRTQIFSTYHWKFFRLWEIYLYDEETYNIFNFIYDKYTKIKDEYCRFKQTSKSIKEFVDYFFKNYYPEKEEEILKYSNWKFKKDLIEYMEKILKDDLEKWSLCWKEKKNL